MSKRVFDKTKTDGASFIKYPLDLLQYRHHPKFMKGAETLFMVIAHYYNAEKQCAFPSMTLLAADCATTESTIDKHIKSLESLGLLVVIRRTKGNLYIPIEPLSRSEFFVKYPEVEAAYNKKYKRVEQRREEQKRYLAEIKNIHDGESYSDETYLEELPF